jgi:hypothetical protein
MLRPLRHHRLLLGPLYASTMLAFVLRLGWAHDPDCPHHAGAHAPAAGGAPSAQAALSAHSAHSAHAQHGAPAANPPSSGPRPESDSHRQHSPSDCQCLDRSCATGSTVVALGATEATDDAVASATRDGAAHTRPADAERAGVYSSHRLPYPHAPPGVDVVT